MAMSKCRGKVGQNGGGATAVFIEQGGNHVELTANYLHRRALCVLAPLLSLQLVPTPLHAAVLEEVVVTATKREESLLDIPISVTAFSAETIESLGFSQSYDIASHVPNMQFMAESSQSTPFIFLRGIGNTSFYASSINPVAVYVDQAYVGQNVAQGFQLFDLERVEVLRGPQGTLFGRNATGGLVNFITRKPEIGADPDARIRLTGGDFGRFDVEAAGGMSLGDQAAVRVAAFQQLGSGMYDHVTPGIGDEDYGDVDNLALRGLLRWAPSTELDVLFNVHYGNDDSHLTAEKPGYIISPFGVPNCPAGAQSGALNNGCSDPFGLGQTVDPDLDHVQFSYAPYQDLETWGISLEVNYEFENHTLTSLTAWDTVDLRRLGDDDANVAVILNDTFLVDTEWFSQELRLASEYTGPWNWILGANYYVDDLKNNLNFAAADLPPPPGIPFPLGLAQDLHQETETWAVFGELTWEVHPDWKFRIGGRLTEDQRSVDINSFAFVASAVRLGAPIPVSDVLAAFAFPLLPQTDLESDWLEWSGRAALDWSFAEDQMLYVSAARGFKGGEFNGGALFDLSEATIADPEFMNNYEIGYKGVLLDGHMHTNITGFYMEYEDQQVLISNPTPFGFLPNLQNAGSSEIMGFEFDVSWQATEAWFLQFGGAYLDAEFEEFFDPTLGIDRAGNSLAHAPEWNLNGIIRYETPVRDGLLAAQMDWWWLDNQYFTVENNPALSEAAHGEVNARVSYLFWDEHVELAMFVKNISDERYSVTGFDTASSGFGANIFVLNRPRTFGGEISIKFD